MKNRRVLFAGLIVIALAAASCGGGDNGDNGGGSGGGGSGFEITTPEDGAEVSTTFTLEVSSDDELGAPDTGLHHIHVFYDGNPDDYEVVESSTFEVKGLDSGEHTVTASLRNADHSEAGAEDEVTVTVAGDAGGGEGDGQDKDGNGGGYDY